MIRVFIVAASPLTRTGLQSVIKVRNVEVVGSVANFEALADRWSDVEADIVLVEASGEQSEAVVDSLAASQLASEAAFVVLSDHSEPRWISEALRIGVRAVLPLEGHLEFPLHSSGQLESHLPSPEWLRLGVARRQHTGALVEGVVGG